MDTCDEMAPTSYYQKYTYIYKSENVTTSNYLNSKKISNNL